jgi:hypothetical protein
MGINRFCFAGMKALLPPCVGGVGCGTRSDTPPAAADGFLEGALRVLGTTTERLGVLASDGRSMYEYSGKGR